MLVVLASIAMLQFSIVEVPRTSGANAHYSPSRAPLRPTPLVKLPISSFAPGGWLKKTLELQRDGLTGHLGEISVWLTKEGNAWLSKDGAGKYGWEELPYWLRGYCRIAFALRDPKMLEETKFWVEGTLGSQRPSGDFGPVHNHRRGFRDLWAQMLMLQVLQSWYEYHDDQRILPFMSKYFQWQLQIPDDQFLKDYWENSRGGDNLASVYWLYNRTGESFLLELATKIHRNTANWRQLGDLPNYHNVNIAQCFREPAIYYQQSSKPDDLTATYRNFDFIREKYGEVPGGMFGADENARPGHDDPHQAIETCGSVEQLGSNLQLLSITADPKWAANTEDVAFNTLPAAFTADYRALRYLTAPNMISSDAKNHAPGLDNPGPFLLMNPFSSRCCQHNHTSAWVNYLESTWMATQDNGLAALHFSEGRVTAKVGKSSQATITTTTRYPFENRVKMSLELARPTDFPLYVLIPEWASGATITRGNETLGVAAGKYAVLKRTWRDGDSIEIHLPMKPRIKRWDQMKNAASVVYGPLTFSLEIEEEYKRVDGRENAQHDAGWQPGADPSKWPTYEILPKSNWNYALLEKPRLTVLKLPWPADDNPFTQKGTPLRISTQGKRLPSWTIDENGLVSILPKSPVTADARVEDITLVPMGAARLRISSFPVAR